MYKAFMGTNGIEYQTNGIDTKIIIDPMPEFPGGIEKLREFLSENISYPGSARKDSVEGKVFVLFLIDKKGKAQNFQVKKGVRTDLNNEALRVVKKMPRWKPGEQNGKPVPVWYTIPINFQLN